MAESNQTPQLRYLKAKYSCEACKVVDEVVLIPERVSPDSDVSEWFGLSLKEIRNAHARRHLLCETTELKMIKIPIPKNDPDAWIGKYCEDGEEEKQ